MFSNLKVIGWVVFAVAAVQLVTGVVNLTNRFAGVSSTPAYFWSAIVRGTASTIICLILSWPIARGSFTAALIVLLIAAMRLIHSIDLIRWMFAGLPINGLESLADRALFILPPVVLLTFAAMALRQSAKTERRQLRAARLRSQIGLSILSVLTLLFAAGVLLLIDFEPRYTTHLLLFSLVPVAVGIGLLIAAVRLHADHRPSLLLPIGLLLVSLVLPRLQTVLSIFHEQHWLRAIPPLFGLYLIWLTADLFTARRQTTEPASYGFTPIMDRPIAGNAPPRP